MRWTMFGTTVLCGLACACGGGPISPAVKVEAGPATGADAGVDVGASADTSAADTVADAVDVPDASTMDADANVQAGLSVLGFMFSDFATSSGLAIVEAKTETVTELPTFKDQDSIVVASEERGFVLHRTDGLVSELSAQAPWEVVRQIDVNGTGTEKVNPYSVVVPADKKAYVIRYGSNRIATVNLETGKVTGEVDLSGYVTDPDGYVEATEGVYDRAKGIVYVLLARADSAGFMEGKAPDYAPPCAASRPAIVGIDSKTDQLVDLNGAKEGLEIGLNGYNPTVMRWDEKARALAVLDIGCYEGDGSNGRKRRGVEVVQPDAAIAQWGLELSDIERPGDLLWVSASEAFLARDDANFQRAWVQFDPKTGKVGQPIPGMPKVPVLDGVGGVFGIRESMSGDKMISTVVHLNLATQEEKTLGVVHGPGSVVGSVGIK